MSDRPAQSTMLLAAEPARRCPACGAALLPGDRFCPNCGAAIQPPPLAPTPDDAPLDRQVGPLDLVSLLVLTAAAFAGAAVVSAVLEKNTGHPLPWPLNTPLRAGGLAAGALLTLGILYLLLLRARQRRRRG